MGRAALSGRSEPAPATTGIDAETLETREDDTLQRFPNDTLPLWSLERPQPRELGQLRIQRARGLEELVAQRRVEHLRQVPSHAVARAARVFFGHMGDVTLEAPPAPPRRR